MKPGQPQNTSGNSSRSKIYLFVSIVLFVLMALVWALDDSFVYVTAGAGAYFLFLWYWNRPKPIVHFTPRSESKNTDDFLEELERSFSTKRTSARPEYKSRPIQVNTKVISAASVFMFGVFFMIVLFVILLSDDTATDEVSLYQQAEQFRYAGEYDSAKFYYKKVIQTDPANAEALFGLGNIFMSQNKYDSALKYFDQCIQIDDQYDDARYNQGLIRYYQERYDLSKQTLRDLLKGNPEYYDATLLMGDNFYAQNEYDSAMYWYEIGYGSGIRSAALCHMMAYIYDLKNKSNKAIPLYQEALSYDSSKVEIYQRLAELLPAKAEEYRKLAQKFK